MEEETTILYRPTGPKELALVRESGFKTWPPHRTSTDCMLYHVTVLSNFARAFDKYEHVYRKAAIPESTYPNEFYLLPEADLHVGVSKAAHLLGRLRVLGDRLLALQAVLPRDRLHANERNGGGLVWPAADLPLSGLREISADGQLGNALSFEDAMASSLALQREAFQSYSDLHPRSISFLPIAKGCQAACPFCFSEASASAQQRPGRLDWSRVDRWLQVAHARRAERAVITGGGEPTLLRWEDLLRLVDACSIRFDKTVLITNGVQLARLDDAAMTQRLSALQEAGLSVLAVSRHHFDEDANERLMRLKTGTPNLLGTWARRRSSLAGLQLRLVCVLQHGGIDSIQAVDDYVRWAVSHDVPEICFKELYVSTSQESVYYSHESNEWSRRHQVPLALVHEWAKTRNLQVQSTLPWGAPIFSGTVNGKTLRIAAYTEPSLFWERTNRVARSWNVMADGSCLVSLEDRRSVIDLDRMTAP